MGIVSLKSNLAINGTPDKYDTQGKLINFPKAGSQLDVDGTPERYDRLGKLDKLPPDSSLLDFNGNLPAPTNAFLNTNALGFTIKNPIGISQFIGINGNTFTNTNGTVINTSAGTGIDFMPNIYANGFTIKNPIGVTQFVGVNGNTFNNPNGTVINTTPGQGVDFFISKAAKGFTIKNPYGESQFLGINGNTYNNPTGNRIGVVNYFPDQTSGATGFKTKVASYETGFIGISADNTKYQYPDSVYGARLLNVTLGPSGGTAKLENQLGAGSKMGNTGFYAENRYSEAVRNDSNQSLLASWALRRRSPSPLEQQYSKFKMRDEAFNPTYIAHPLILRGIQNPDILNPQRWGIDALGQQEGRTAANNLAAALDGGFIRGGASTALERSAIDTARLAKFMASPKGIIWAITQVGLGKSNPLVEKNPENVLSFNDTRSHSGISTLLSVPGSAFGLHFTRHGIPFLNEAASYEKVIQYQTKNSNENIRSNRLLKLSNELLSPAGGSPSSNALAKLQKLSSIVKGNDNPVIQTLSGLGGPGSVYGLGSTTIRRYTHSREFGITFSKDDKVTETLLGNSRTPYHDSDGNITMDYYAGLLKTPTSHLGNPKISSNANGRDRDAFGIDDLDRDVNDNPHNLTRWLGQTVADGNEPGNNYSEGKSLRVQNPAFPASLTDRDHRFSTLPYAEIRKIAKDRPSRTIQINDFRTNLTGDTKTFSTSTDNVNYTDGSLSKRYGFGDHGNPNADRSDPYTRTSIDGAGQEQDRGNIDSALGDIKTKGRFGISNANGFRGDKITAIDYNAKSISQNDIYPDGVRDFIKFYFSGIDLYDDGKDNVIVFRSTIKDLADSFSPSWSTVSIIGRPDGPAIYSSFERNISFNFTVAATSREELVPMWRKLNYLATFTMPIYGGGKPGGALCRMTIGDMFNNTPGYFTGLTIGVNEESSWDLADDATADKTNTIRKKKNKYSKQLPTIVDVDVQFKIIHDWRPQQGGRAYHLYKGNYTPASQDGSWLWDSNI
jgi:hypothetical protein